MREIKLYLDKTEYKPGETISGTAEIISDKDFGFNEMYVELQGREHTWVRVQAGKHSITYTEEHFHVNEKYELMAPGEMQTGEARIPFSFQLPEVLPTSYDGTRGYIEYTLEGKIEVSWARDPKDKIELMVKGNPSEINPSSISKSEMDDGAPVLDAELENDEIYPGDVILVKYRIERDDKMRGVRIDLETKEWVTAQGHEREHNKKHSEVYIEDDQVVRGVWRTVEIQALLDMHETYAGPLVRLESYVKVVIDIPWGLDKDVILPLKVCRKKDDVGGLFDDFSSEQFEF